MITERFSGLDQIDRQRLVWDALRRSLSEAELPHVGLLLTFTPSEANAVREG